MSRLEICPGYFRSDQKAGQQSFTAAGLYLGLSWQRKRWARGKAVSFWTSLNTDKVGAGKSIPVIIQTGDGKYYVSETTTGKRNGKDYVTISESLTPNQYTQTLKKGKEYSSLEAAYDAYLKALEQYDSVRQP